MRFDLEIPALNNIELTYIKGGSSIPSSAAPLLYCDINKKDMFPSDFISAEVSYFPREYITGGYEITHGPSILNIKSDKFIVTDMAQFVYDGESEVPLFYKHIIGDAVKEDAIRIVDFFGIAVNRNEYMVEEGSTGTTIYMNDQDKILFVEYVSQNAVNKVLLNLVPVFQEAGWADIVDGEIARHKYVLRDGRIDTAHDDVLYIAYISDTKLFRNVNGNLDDPWYVGVLNADFKVGNYRYWIPEYYVQQLSGDFRYKLIEEKKCRHLFGNYVRTQYPIADNEQSSIYVYVKDAFTDEVKYACTTNRDLDGKLYKENVYYRMINSFNIKGILELPVTMEDNLVAYATHYTNEPYYEYNGIDLNSSLANHVDYFAIFIKPNVTDTGFALGHAVIGQGATGNYSFDSIDSYKAAIADSANTEMYKAYTVAILTINSNINTGNYRLIEQKTKGNIILDKLSASKVSSDIIAQDISNGKINIPTNDTLVAAVDITRLIKNGQIQYDTEKIGSECFDDFGAKYIQFIKKKLDENLDASTHAILEINAEGLIT